MKYIVERHYNNTVGTREFKTKEEAENYLNSGRVREDEEYGFWFRIVGAVE